MIDVIWENVKNLTPTTAKCPLCNKIFEVDDSYLKIYKDSEMTGKIMKPGCCTGFWAIWRRGYGEWWEFQIKGGGEHVQESPTYRQGPVYCGE